MKNVFIFGASGHAKVVIDILERMEGYSIIAVIDDDASLWKTELLDYPVIGGRQYLLDGSVSKNANGIVAIGNNQARLKVAAWLKEQGVVLCNAIHPGVQIGRDVHIGAGTVIMAGTVINSGAWVGENAVINTGVTVDHDCIIEGGVHIAPGCNICGGVTVGEGSLVGAGSVIIPGITIGINAVVGAGSTVIKSVPDGETVVGSPSRIMVKK